MPGPLNLILDQGVPRGAALLFRKFGFECTHVSEIGMSNADDRSILEWAAENRAVVLTLDADFHTILAVSGARGPSAIRLRIQGVNAGRFVVLMQNALTRFEAELNAGCVVTVKAQKITCHRLPIGRTDL